MILFLVFFDLIWTAAAVFLWFNEAPLPFKIIWPVSSGIIWLVLLNLVLSRRDLRLAPNGLHVHLWRFGFSKRESVTPGEIVSVIHDSNAKVNNTPIFSVKVERRTGKPVTVASGITGEPAAIGLVAEIEAWRSRHA